MNLDYIKEFPISLSLNKLGIKIESRFHAKSLLEKARIKKDRLIFDYLNSFYQDVYFVENHQVAENPKIIWVMWQQGFDKAPDIVKLCHQSLLKNKPEDVQVIEITDQNIFDFVTFPDFIMKKYHNGNISRAHFSDLVRIRLLALYGGIWFDATDFISKPIPEKIFSDSFFTSRGALHPNNLLPFLKGQWEIFAIGGSNRDFFRLIDKLAVQYWEKHNSAIDYWITDYIIQYAYTHFNFVGELIDNCPVNNTHIHDIEFLIRGNCDKCDFEKILYQSDTYIHKLSYKSNVINPESEGYRTFTDVIHTKK